MQAGMHFSGKYTTSYQYPPDHPIMLKLLMWLHHVTWQTVCGSLRSLFFFCTVNSYTTINYLPTMNSMRHPLITHDVLMKFSWAQCCKSYDNHTSSSWLLLWASHEPNSWEAHEPPTNSPMPHAANLTILCQYSQYWMQYCNQCYLKCWKQTPKPGSFSSRYFCNGKFFTSIKTLLFHYRFDAMLKADVTVM